MKLSKAHKELLLDVLQQEETDAFIEEDGLIYCNFDSIVFQNKDYYVEASFLFKGVKVYFIELDRAQICDDAEFTLGGIEGRMRVILNE